MRLFIYLCLINFFYCFLPNCVEAQVPRLGISTQKKQTETHQLNYAEIDEYASNAPEFRKQVDLVDYLIKPYQNNDFAKTRVIFAWIAYHVQYDYFQYNAKKRIKGLGDTYKTRIGVCADFAKLFVEMARKANLKAEYISGYAGYDLTTDEIDNSHHAWNAVKINKKWYLLDVTWALGGDFGAFKDVKKLKQYKRLVKQRKKNLQGVDMGEARHINNKWFLTPPEIMIETHFPKNIKWQLLEKSVTPKKIWRENKIKKQKNEKI